MTYPGDPAAQLAADLKTIREGAGPRRGGVLNKARQSAALDVELRETLIRELSALRAHSTELASLVGAMTVNETLETGVDTPDATGVWSKDWRVPFAAVTVIDLGGAGGAGLTVQAASPGSAAPSRGAAMFTVTPGGWACLPLSGNALSVYGTAGRSFVYSVSARPLPAAAGIVDAGANPATSSVVTTTAVDPGVGADPAALVVPPGQTWVLQSVRVVLVTSAVVANRRPNLLLDDGTNVFAKFPGNVDTASSTTATNWYEFGGAIAQVGQEGVAYMQRMTLAPGYRIRVQTDLLDVGDDYQSVVYNYFRYL